MLEKQFTSSITGLTSVACRVLPRVRPQHPNGIFCGCPYGWRSYTREDPTADVIASG